MNSRLIPSLYTKEKGVAANRHLAQVRYAAHRQEANIRVRFALSGLLAFGGFFGLTKPSAAQVTAYVNCSGFEGVQPPEQARSSQQAPVFESPESAWVVAKLKCGEKVEFLGPSDVPGHAEWFRVRTKHGEKGYLHVIHVSYFKDPGPVFIGRAIGYRFVPYQQTTYLRFGQYSSDTTCYGSGDSFAWHLSCDTTYTTPTVIPVTWGYTDTYNFVETKQGRYVIGCRAHWRWSHCFGLIPDSVFQTQIQGNQMWVAGVKDSKVTIAKFDILQFEPKQGHPPSPSKP